MSSAEATRRSPTVGTLPRGTMTAAPSSSRRIRMSSSFCPAISCTSTPTTAQTPWFG